MKKILLYLIYNIVTFLTLICVFKYNLCYNYFLQDLKNSVRTLQYIYDKNYNEENRNEFCNNIKYCTYCQLSSIYSNIKCYWDLELNSCRLSTNNLFYLNSTDFYNEITFYNIKDFYYIKEQNDFSIVWRYINYCFMANDTNKSLNSCKYKTTNTTFSKNKLDTIVDIDFNTEINILTKENMEKYIAYPTKTYLPNKIDISEINNSNYLYCLWVATNKNKSSKVYIKYINLSNSYDFYISLFLYYNLDDDDNYSVNIFNTSYKKNKNFKEITLLNDEEYVVNNINYIIIRFTAFSQFYLPSINIQLLIYTNDWIINNSLYNSNSHVNIKNSSAIILNSNSNKNQIDSNGLITILIPLFTGFLCCFACCVIMYSYCVKKSYSNKIHNSNRLSIRIENNNALNNMQSFNYNSNDINISLGSNINNSFANNNVNSFARMNRINIVNSIRNRDPNNIILEEGTRNTNLNKLKDKLVNGELKGEYYNSKLNTYNSNCTICLDSYSIKSLVVSLLCKHIFHKECLKEWLEKNICNPKCPNCNFNVLKNIYVDEKLNLNTRINRRNIYDNNNNINQNNNNNNYIRNNVQFENSRFRNNYIRILNNQHSEILRLRNNNNNNLIDNSNNNNNQDILLNNINETRHLGSTAINNRN